MSEPRTLRPDEVWDALVDMAIHEEAERVDALSPDEVARALAAQGKDPAAERAKALALIARLGTKTAAPVEREISGARVRPAPGSKTRPRVLVWMLAAALSGGAVLLMAGWPSVTALFKRETPTIAPDNGAPVRLAAKLRDDARAACEQKEWAVCLTKLDEAKRYDPAGETSAPVKDMRRTIELNTKVVPQRPFDEKQTPLDEKGTGTGMKER